jgi:hypothetical protein
MMMARALAMAMVLALAIALSLANYKEMSNAHTVYTNCNRNANPRRSHGGGSF